MSTSASRILLLLLAAAAIPACGGGSGGGGLFASNTGGGSASGPAGLSVGGAANNIRIFSEGAITFGVNVARTKSATPPAPPAAPEITDLSANVNLAGSGQITGTLTGSGAALRTITVAGDLLISGTLLSGQFGGTQINLQISALDGTVYISGQIVGTSKDGTADGTSGGSITITANKIVLTGLIESQGERNTAGGGGTGGNVILDTVGGNAGRDIFIHGGTIDTTGGDGTTIGGGGGAITFNSADDIEVFSDLLAPGGNAKGTADNVAGGAGGNISLDAADALFMNSTVDAHGGDATTSGDGAAAGKGGDFQVQSNFGPTGEASLFGSQNLGGGRAQASSSGGNSVTGGGGGLFRVGISTSAGPSLVDLPRADFSMTGGQSTGQGGHGTASSTISTNAGGIIFNGTANISDGDSKEGSGSAGGTLAFLAVTGDVVINGNLTGNGGSGDTSPGTGKLFSFTANQGNIDVHGKLTSNGGSATGSANVAGANAGGPFNFGFAAPYAPRTVRIFPTCSMTANGGRGSGNGNGGSGGVVFISTESDIVIGGDHQLNGGAAAGSGTGGTGGFFIANSDSSGDGLAGDITLQSGASVTANGGTGATGGGGGVVLFDADGNDGDFLAGNGFVVNDGIITVKGAATNGNGGTVIFDGKRAGPAIGPLAGSLVLDGSGSGSIGTFTSQ